MRGLSKSYPEGDGQRQVFHELEAEISAGEFVMLVGPSGSGKTTLLNLISGIDLADSGLVRVCGQDLARLSERERTLLRRERIGFVFQFFNLIPTLTVEENLCLPIELKRGLDGAARERALELLERVGLADRANTFPDRLSGGEKQRVAVARALAHDPDLILADEPTGNLDEESADALVHWIEEMLRPARKTLVLVTHNRQLHSIADRVLCVHDHKLVPETQP
jgi:putative ABC transport system ATP-binding protein